MKPLQFPQLLHWCSPADHQILNFLLKILKNPHQIQAEIYHQILPFFKLNQPLSFFSFWKLSRKVMSTFGLKASILQSATIGGKLLRQGNTDLWAIVFFFYLNPDQKKKITQNQTKSRAESKPNYIGLLKCDCLISFECLSFWAIQVISQFCIWKLYFTIYELKMLNGSHIIKGKWKVMKKIGQGAFGKPFY